LTNKYSEVVHHVIKSYSKLQIWWRLWLGQPKVNKVDFSAVLKLHETSTNQISCSYHEGIPSYQVKNKQIYH